ncbi:cadherin-like beta sandwich domain-containing protein [Paenibacillus tyrfis]|uniref:cadherin-like beta sandwich domain-containing protein n=1 Tax=Paenibacillus tyrfis TaxID=1501230 RepID=UPI00209F741F|nr:cadherin-like beta sandwich domain-containing protein [Paenibacillus tyrfis]MCP1311886.1 S-layer homology domain-containing protein [Paenibacillus tyrfis]
MWALQTARNGIIYTFIPKTAFSIHSFSSYADNENAVASNILDGQETTIWHSKWEAPAAPFPHWVIIDMESTYKLNGIQRKSRPNQSAMEFPKTFELYASDNPADLNDPAFLSNAANKASGTFGKTWTGNVYTDFVSLDKAVQGRYVKFVVTGTYNTDPSKTFTSMSEIDFTGDKVASGNANLTDLKINGVSVDGFTPNTLEYSLNVPNTVTNAKVTFTTSEPQATVVVNGGSNLQAGNNVVTVNITAPNGNVRSYVINLNRADISPASLSDLRVNGVTLSGFAWDKFDYSLSVPYETTVTSITYSTASPTSTVAVTGGDKLIVGKNTVTVTVTAQDGTKSIYSIVITRQPQGLSSDSSLLDLRVNGKTLDGFASDKLNYSLSVPYETTVTSITYSAAIPAATVVIAGGDKLIVGVNTVTVTVTAQDGTKSIYSIAITRQPQALSSNANLLDLRVNHITLNGFAPDKLSYTVDVSYGTTVAAVTYSAEHATSRVVVTGGSNLLVGSNRISVLVTAQDGTTKEYVILVHRLPDSSGSSESSPSSPTAVVPPKKPELPGNSAVIKDEDLQKNSASISVALTEGQNRIIIPIAQVDQLNGRPLHVQAHDVKLIVPADLLKSATSLLPSVDDSAAITVKIEPVSAEQANRTLKEASSKDNGLYTLGGKVFDLAIFVTDAAGKQYEMSELKKPVSITFPIPVGMNPRLAGIYKILDNGSLTYLGGTLTNRNTAIEVGIDRLGHYAVLSLEKNYSDVTRMHWAYSTIQELSARHIVNGVTNSSFAPAQDVSRAEFASLLVRILHLKSSETASFGDVAGNAWYAKEVSAAYKAGIITGDSRQMFEPNRSITREEMAIMLVRAYEYRTGVKLEKASTEISDASMVSDWALPYVNSAIKAKLLTGRQEGLFVPAEHTTRAEAAQRFTTY